MVATYISTKFSSDHRFLISQIVAIFQECKLAPRLRASQTGMLLRLNPESWDCQNRFPSPKAAVNAPHSRRFARSGHARQSRSVWTAVALAPLFGCMRCAILEERTSPSGNQTGTPCDSIL